VVKVLPATVPTAAAADTASSGKDAHVYGRRPTVLAWGTLLALAAGCSGPAADPPAPPAETQLARDFDPATAGSVEGCVTWAGDVQVVPPWTAWHGADEAAPGRHLHANPNAPRVDSQTHAVAGAVVFLRGVEPRRSRPWDHLPVRVEEGEEELVVRQGFAAVAHGVVRRGAAVTLVPSPKALHLVHAGGAAFFTLTLPAGAPPRTRTLGAAGVVELGSGDGEFWRRAYLFVDDHPYYAVTDTQGRYALDRIPPGEYELACWLPSWRVERQERDPESAAVTRVTFRPPATVTRPVTVGPGESGCASFTLSSSDFP
jgi:hypothetical protein